LSSPVGCDLLPWWGEGRQNFTAAKGGGAADCSGELMKTEDTRPPARPLNFAAAAAPTSS
ncbi:hypothetical protein, partial [Pelagibius sp. Alg239-R121]|uniref:hypothetical protein n=1 Tax=Pelagibius sp. Alg239-R121 TaxID=2993448 RepID=UPI0024A78C30